MEDSVKFQGSCSYEGRAQRLKTAKQQKVQAEKQEKQRVAKQGMTKEEYWRACVKCEQDVVTYYELYHPEYPPELQKAIARRFSQLIDSSRENKLTPEEYRTYMCGKSSKDHEEEQKERVNELVKEAMEQGVLKELEAQQVMFDSSAKPWKPEDEIQNQKNIGLINVAQKNMEKLLSEYTK